MKHIFCHIKTYMVRGLLAVIPFTLALFAVQILYVMIDKRMSLIAGRIFGVHIPGLGILLLLALLYVIGLTLSNVVGRRLLRFFEWVTNRIPLVKTVYNAGKQLTKTLSLSDTQIFKRVVLVEVGNGKRMIGLVTGEMADQRQAGEQFIKVFIPTTPTPTSGFTVVIKNSEAEDPGWSVEETLKTVVSGGLIGPSEIYSFSQTSG